MLASDTLSLVDNWLAQMHVIRDKYQARLSVSRKTPEHFLGANAERARKLPATCAALLAAREEDIASRTEVCNSAPDNMWGQDYGT